MKLNLVSEDSKETIGIEVSDQCTLQNLKQTLIQTLASSLHLSLNRRDEIRASSPEDSLSSVGITSGEQVFFTFNPSRFSSQPGTSSIQSSSQDKGKQIMQSPTTDFDPEKPRLENLEHESLIRDASKNCSRSNFLRRVMKEKLGHSSSSSNFHKLLVTAVHAVLLESGFVPIDRFDIPENWPSPSFSISVRYILPHHSILNDKTILLKFQSLVRFVIVYESVSCNVRSNVRRCVSLDVLTFAPNFFLIWEDMMSINTMDENEWNGIEIGVCEFWKVVKNAFELPLLLLLPLDMKLKILQALSGVEIGRIQCVCTELRNLASDNDLWKMKFLKEFPTEDDPEPETNLWKPKFVASYRTRIMRNRRDRYQNVFRVPAYRLYDRNRWQPGEHHAWRRILGHHAWRRILGLARRRRPWLRRQQ